MSNLLYEGIFLANRSDIIVVTVTYRLGALGFLVTSGLKYGAACAHAPTAVPAHRH